jgi:dTDP-4-dehydrorhamnose 3,5-epimerase
VIFHKTGLAGAFVIEYEAIADERGFFARTWCQEEFQRQGLNHELAQCNISFNKQRGTLRGMHYQVYPNEEAKLVRCTRGAIYDVIIDLRPSSPTLLSWFGVELSETNNNMLYVPEAFAHGFVTLDDNTEVFYQMSADYHSESARGVRWNDPAFGIHWPIPVEIISQKDMSYGDYRL